MDLDCGSAMGVDWASLDGFSLWRHAIRGFGRPLLPFDVERHRLPILCELRNTTSADRGVFRWGSAAACVAASSEYLVTAR